MQPASRNLLVALALVLSLVPLAPGAATARETAFVVTTGAQYRNALTALSADDTGPHLITLGADINLAIDDDPTYTGTQPLTIDGQGFTIDGMDLNRALDATGSTAAITIEDLTVVNANADGDGGAVATGGLLTVRDAVFSDADGGTGFGGALWSEGGITIERSSFTANTAERGGAVFALGSDISVTDSSFDANAATSGGGAVRAEHNFSGGGLTVLRSQFTDNQTLTFDGGAVRARTATISESSFVGNTAEGLGGGLYAATIEIANTTFAFNEAETGAAIGVQPTVSPTADLHHVTFLDNIGDAQVAIEAPGTVPLTSRASVFVASQFGGGDCANVVTTSLGHNRYVEDSMSEGGSEGGSCGLDDPTDAGIQDAGLGPIRDNGGPTETSYPLAGSPLVDAIPPGDCTPPTDQRGVARPFASGCDVGAVEQVYPAHGFGDVPPWVEDTVRWITSTVNDPQLMTGITPTTFKPNDPITRAQVVRLLYREAGSPDVSGYDPHGFTDVPAWVEDAVRWAKGEDIATGITATTFVPNDPITRGQVTRMKYRFAGSRDVEFTDPHPFTDVPGWVEDAVTWAADPDNPLPLATGITPTTFRPNDPITRAQVARMDYRLAITPNAWQGQPPATMPLQGRFLKVS